MPRYISSGVVRMEMELAGIVDVTMMGDDPAITTRPPSISLSDEVMSRKEAHEKVDAFFDTLEEIQNVSAYFGEREGSVEAGQLD